MKLKAHQIKELHRYILKGMKSAPGPKNTKRIAAKLMLDNVFVPLVQEYMDNGFDFDVAFEAVKMNIAEGIAESIEQGDIDPDEIDKDKIRERLNRLDG